MKDLTNKTYGKWTVIKRDTQKYHRPCVRWICRCSCGTIKSIDYSDLQKGNTSGCKNCWIPHNKSEDLTGKTFGKWQVIKQIGSNKFQHIVYLCLCACGEEKEVEGASLRAGTTTKCKNCMKKHPMNEVFLRIKERAQKRAIIMTITPKDLLNQWEKQNHKCAFTNLELVIYSKYKSKKYNLETTASVDRIDSSKGYEVGNIQWVHKYVNIMKWDRKKEEFIKFCKLVASNN